MKLLNQIILLSRPFNIFIATASAIIMSLIIPNSDYYDYWYPKQRWGSTTSLSNSIGQGEVLTTPIQLANMTAAIANRGWFITPHFVKKISNDSILSKYKEKKYTTIDEKHFETVIEGMFNVIENLRRFK